MQTKKVSRKLKVRKTCKVKKGGSKIVVTVNSEDSEDVIKKKLSDDTITHIVVNNFTETSTETSTVTLATLWNIAKKIQTLKFLTNITFFNCVISAISGIIILSNVGTGPETNFNTRLNVEVDNCTGDDLILDQSRINIIKITNCTINKIIVENSERNQQGNKERTNTNNTRDSTFTYDTIRIENSKPIEGEYIYVKFRDTITSFGRKVLRELYIPKNVIYKSINGTNDNPFPENSQIPYELSVYREKVEHNIKTNSDTNSDTKRLEYVKEKEFPSYNKQHNQSKASRRN